MNLPFSLGEVLLETGLEFGIGRLLDHVRECFRDLVFGVVQILKRVLEEVFQRLDVLC
jgi:hypothetical protein